MLGGGLLQYQKFGQPDSLRICSKLALEKTLIIMNQSTVHPRLSEQVELNILLCGSDTPEIRIMEDDVLNLL